MLRELVGDTPTAHVAEQIGITPSGLSQFLSGARKIGDKAAINLEGALGVPEGTLAMPWASSGAPAAATTVCEGRTVDVRISRLSLTDYPPKSGDRPVFGADPCGPVVEVVTDDLDAYAARVVDDSLAPAIRLNWIIWFEPGRQAKGGDFVMVKTLKGETFIKELLYANDLEVSLMSINPDYRRVTLQAAEVASIDCVAGVIPPSKAIF